jgi:hypothetical protein
MKYELSVGEIGLLIEALTRAASRHESYSRVNPRSAGAHDRKAKAMRQLSIKLLAKQKEDVNG